MRNSTKLILFYIGLLITTCALAVNLAEAQENKEPNDKPYINQARLEQILAPIALYPDTLLSQVLVAATYPLEVVQAQRWREQNKALTADQALTYVEDKDWAPSVKALSPFTDLLNQMSEDLDWLQEIGDAFLANEEQVLSAVQVLRTKAQDAGSLSSNDYITVEKEQEHIVIQPAQTRVVYVPYYDTRYVYGSWHHDYSPYYWHRPAHYHAYGRHSYWSPSIHIRLGSFYSGFQWHKRHTVVYRQPYYSHHSYATRSHEYQRWRHSYKHRRNVSYRHHSTHRRYVSSKEYQPNKQWRGNRSVTKDSGKAVATREYQNTQSYSSRHANNQRLNKREIHNKRNVKRKTYSASNQRTQTYKTKRKQYSSNKTYATKKVKQRSKQYKQRAKTSRNTHHKKSRHREHTSLKRAKTRSR